MGFSDTPLLIKIALIVSAVAFLIHIIGFSTTTWIEIDFIQFGSASSGLWKFSSSGQTADIPDRSLDDAFKATRAFECLGLIAGVACTVLILIYMFVKRENIIKLLSAVAGIVAGVLILIAVIIYGTRDGLSQQSVSLGYSFGLAIVGGILYVATGVLILLVGVISV